MSTASTRARKSSQVTGSGKVRTIPSWMPRVHRILEVLSTGGGALLTKKAEPTPPKKHAA